MKKALLVAGLLIAGLTHAQNCSELFISEYLEGTNNNKALEIYNPTNETINLSNYFVVRYNNGSSNPTLASAEQLIGTIAPKDVYVAAVDKRNPAGSGQEAPLWDSLLVRVDGFYSPVYTTNNTFYWNGNDAVVLFKGVLPTGVPNTTEISTLSNVMPIDRVGRVTENPGTAWTYDNTPGGVLATIDAFLVRKSTVKGGDNQIAATFNASLTWDLVDLWTYILDENGDTVKNAQGYNVRYVDFSSLGSHDCECNTLSASTIESNQLLSVYPNPSNGEFVVEASSGIKSIAVYNSLGQIVRNINVGNQMTAKVNLGNNVGVYILKIETGKGSRIERVIVK